MVLRKVNYASPPPPVTVDRSRRGSGSCEGEGEESGTREQRNTTTGDSRSVGQSQDQRILYSSDIQTDQVD